MAIVIKDNFNLGAAKPIDSRLSIGKFSELLAKNYSVYDSYAGMLVYVEEDETIGSGESATTYKKGYYKLNSYVEENADTAASWQYLPALSGSTTIEGTIENAEQAEKDGLGNVISESYVSGAKVNGSNIELNAKSGTTLATIKPADVIEFSSDDSNNIVIGHKESVVKDEDIIKDEVLATVKTDAYGHIVSATQITVQDLADYNINASDVDDENNTLAYEILSKNLVSGQLIEVSTLSDASNSNKIIINHTIPTETENSGFGTFSWDNYGHISGFNSIDASDLVSYCGEDNYSVQDLIIKEISENLAIDLNFNQDGGVSSDNVITTNVEVYNGTNIITARHNIQVNTIDINGKIGGYTYTDYTDNGYTFGRGYLTLSAIDYDETGHISAAKTLTSSDLLNYTSGADGEKTLKELIVDAVNTDLEKLKEGQEITVDNENKFWITGITTSTDETEEDASISASQVINTSAYVDVDNGNTTLHIDAISPSENSSNDYVNGTIESATKLSKKITIQEELTEIGDHPAIGFGSVETDFSEDITLKFNSIDFDAFSEIYGVLPIESIPQAALERCVIVGTVEEMLSLGSDDIQTGDTVKVSGGYVASTEGEYVLDGDDYREYNEDTDTDLPRYTYEQPAMYFVKDTEKLGTLDAFEVYYAGNSATADVANRVKNGLTIKVDGTSNYYDGSSAKTIEIKSTEVSITPIIKENDGEAEAIATITVNGEDTTLYTKNSKYLLNTRWFANKDGSEDNRVGIWLWGDNPDDYSSLTTEGSIIEVVGGKNITIKDAESFISDDYAFSISADDEKVIANPLTAPDKSTTNLTAYLLATTNTDEEAHTVNYVKNITADLNGVLTANEFKGNINVNYLTQAEVTKDTDYATYEDMLVFDCGSASGF
jgi:hypothetical protein